MNYTRNTATLRHVLVRHQIHYRSIASGCMTGARSTKFHLNIQTSVFQLGTKLEKGESSSSSRIHGECVIGGCKSKKLSLYLFLRIKYPCTTMNACLKKHSTLKVVTNIVLLRRITCSRETAAQS